MDIETRVVFADVLEWMNAVTAKCPLCPDRDRPVDTWAYWLQARQQCK